MSEATPNLALPLLAAAQAQKHVTHNEALMGLDTLVQLAVLDKDLLAPPASAAEGDRYLLAGANPTGAWAGWAGRVVRYQDGRWLSFIPRPGWLAYVVDEGDLYTYAAAPAGAAGPAGGGAWVGFRSSLSALQNLARLGIGTTADAANPFAAKLNKALWAALPAAEGGSGDLRYTLTKEAAGNTLSLLLQSGWSGRAELGLTGDDDLHLKVSGDGATWTEALRVDRATGGVDWRAAEASVAAGPSVDLGAVNALCVTLTGAATVTSFGSAPRRLRLLRFSGAIGLTHDPARLILPGGATLVTAAGDTALATSDAAGAWTVRAYSRASGRALAGPAAAEIADATATGRAVLTAASAAAGASALGLGSESAPTFAGLTISGWSTFSAGTASFIGTTGTIAVASGTPRLEVRAGTGTGDAAFMAFHRPGQFAAYFGLDVDNAWKVGGWSMGANAYRIFHQGFRDATKADLSGAAFAGPVRLPGYTVATVPSAAAAGAGAQIHVANEAGGPVPAFSDGATWRRVTDRAAIS
ncbi:DUF2793 domain-containing protein [Methylobacterium sp. WSM2598]|uniref:DUF2793 domain-containing protein n=1 Tax=Methylobacterium sp. WSM2598 TaxID=398261 RepID=UPI00035E8131|nr:DUF2793 domain-containing protein [Methylobacterium sp. WSM2598]